MFPLPGASSPYASFNAAETVSGVIKIITIVITLATLMMARLQGGAVRFSQASRSSYAWLLFVKLQEMWAACQSAIYHCFELQAARDEKRMTREQGKQNFFSSNF